VDQYSINLILDLHFRHVLESLDPLILGSGVSVKYELKLGKCT